MRVTTSVDNNGDYYNGGLDGNKDENDDGGGLDDDDHNPQHPACPLFTFGGVDGNFLDGAAAEME